MINNFKNPNVKSPRYREKRLGLLNAKTIKEFKNKYPIYENIENETLKSIIKLFNTRIWQTVIKHRDGVELPESLGYLFIGTCPPAKSVNVNYNLSKQYGKILQNRNWETDGNIGKIFYTNWSAKYRFKNRELWRFEASRKFKRTVAQEYPKNWTKYVFMKNKYRVGNLYASKKEEKTGD